MSDGSSCRLRCRLDSGDRSRPLSGRGAGILKKHGVFLDKHTLPEAVHVDEPAGRNLSIL